jgi:hypothetical protein
MSTRIWLAVLATAACSNSHGIDPRIDASGGADDALHDSTSLDASTDAQTGCAMPANLGRGLSWVRSQPMMIAGLSVAMGAPSSAAVGEYFDTFHANTVHTWENGLPTEIAGWAAANHAGFRYISWVGPDGKSVANAQMLGGVAPMTGRIGYQIGDEPTDMTTFNAMVAGATAVGTADPDALRIINLNDSSAANSLRTMAAQSTAFDILSYDHYEWGTGAHEGLMSTRTAALAAGKPYWRYVKSFYYKSDSAEGDASDMRWDALVGAVYGFTGATWFVYSIEAGSVDLAPLLFAAGGDFAGTKTARYAEAAAANVMLEHVGKVITQLHSTDVRYVAKIVNTSGLEAWAKGAGGDPFLSSISLGSQADALVGTFRDDCDEAYVMLQNQAHDGADFPNSSSTAKSFTLNFDFTGATDPSLDKTALLSLDPETGTVSSVALTSTGTNTAKLTVSLPAGGVVFVKYKTARSFAGL